ncbi:ATP-dependent DNA helicase DinG [Carnobacterium pleistocenium]|uniref:ATP-dependent DNA helicase DinG n=1 Tax=Carnobacterium pleistocenium TaxID=181073 RepID=UPI000551D05B|nr:ATP-dependent DNA helicase DinG [Carnobacterium pleistocenium]
MKNKDTYAVVDIETTGGNVASGDRMIQFGCVLIEDDQIVHRFATNINPLITIPKQIEHLTNLSNKSVALAPYFEDIAATIYNLLDGCIIIAHNIQFDYVFLSGELQRCGMPPLQNKGIDTVELAQILLPTESSYRLNDLVSKFNIEHTNPHQADSDAAVTAELFLVLKQKLKELPLVTVEKMVELSENLTMETGYFFKTTLAEMKNNRLSLSESLMIKNGIALKIKQPIFEQKNYREDAHYPTTVSNKEQLFQTKLTTRNQQIKMMDAVYDYFTSNETSHFAIEAATGVGKTLGYLLPLAYLATIEDPVVISTYTTLLQKQLLDKDIVQLNTILPFTVQAAILKSKNHYIHLTKFEEALKDSVDQKVEVIYKMKLLTWLTETETGDLDELNLTNYNHLFWNKIRHRGWLTKHEDDQWHNEDFYLHAQYKIKHASVIITNHSFLCHDLNRKEKELPKIKKLIIDEAQHLPDIAMEASSEVFGYYRMQQLIKLIGHASDEKSFLGRITQLSQQLSKIKLSYIENMEMNLFSLEDELTDFIYQLLVYCKNTAGNELYQQEQLDIQFNRETQWNLTLKKSSKKVLALMNEISYLGFELVNQGLNESHQLTQRERYLLEDFFDVIETFESQKDIFNAVFQKNEENEVTWFSYKEKSPKNSFMIKRSKVDSSKFIKENLLDKTAFVLYTGATLEINRSFSYFETQLGEENLKELIIESPYDYKKQARLWVPKELKSIKELSKKDYVHMIVEQVENIIKNSTENTMVLFNSYEILQEVYFALQRKPTAAGRELLAQGFSGSRERILKRFFRSTGGILLGADSFWEGVDLPGKSLSIIVITRLPFESPDRPFVKVKHRYLEQKHLNPFTIDSLPKATLRLKQGFGRLIRSESDKGIMIVLDNRLIQTSYGKQIIKSLPKGLPIEEIATKNIGKKLQQFFNSEENKDN